MKIQTRRVAVAAAIKTAPAGTGKWAGDTLSDAHLNAVYTGVVGHAAPTPGSFKAAGLPLPVRLYANEGTSKSAAAVLYDALDWTDPTSVVSKLKALPWVRGVAVDDVAVIPEGQTKFLVGSLTVTVDLTEVDDPPVLS